MLTNQNDNSHNDGKGAARKDDSGKVMVDV